MKQIPLLQGAVLLIELPEGATDYHVCNADGHESFSCFFIRTHTVDLPPGNWQIVGMLSEVTERQAAELVDYDEDERYYKAYGKHSQVHKNGIVSQLVGYLDARESLESSILAEGYLLESPPAPKCGCFGPAEEGVCNACDEWMTAQSRVLDRSRCLLLGREYG